MDIEHCSGGCSSNMGYSSSKGDGILDIEHSSWGGILKIERSSGGEDGISGINNFFFFVLPEAGYGTALERRVIYQRWRIVWRLNLRD